MKNTTVIAGVCLLALIIASTDALEKRHDVNDCASLAVDAAPCLTAPLTRDLNTFCSCSCKSILYEYFDQCDLSDTARVSYDQICGASDGGAEDEADNGDTYTARSSC